jgi:hypothetical protein
MISLMPPMRPMRRTSRVSFPGRREYRAPFIDTVQQTLRRSAGMAVAVFLSRGSMTVRFHGCRHRCFSHSAKPLADALVWPAPFTLEMRSCGFPNAQRVLDCSSDRTQAHKKHTRTARKMIPLEILGSRSGRHKSPRAVIASRSRFRFVRYIRRASTPPPACSVGPSLTLSCPLAKWSVASTGAATTPYDGSPA